MRAPSSAVGLVVILLLGCSGSSDATDNPWILDPTSRPEQTILLQTTFKDPEFEDYAPNPLHTYDAGGLTTLQILDWYEENMAADGWKPVARDDHQIIFSRRGARQVHFLIVLISGDRKELHEGPVDEYTVEEYEAE